MTLLELYEPLFQYICTFNRNARGGGQLHFETTRDEILTLLNEITAQANESAKLATQAAAMRMPIIYFVDSMISESRAPFAREWNAGRLAFEENVRAGDQLFFEEELEPTLADNSEEATERLAVFFVCLGLGFTGDLIGESGQKALKNYSQKIFVRIKSMVETDPRAKISKEAYFADERTLTEPPSRKFILLSILFICCALGVLVLYGVMYAQAKKDFSKSVNAVAERQTPIKR
jgi:type VI protein secretion system component VasF